MAKTKQKSPPEKTDETIQRFITFNLADEKTQDTINSYVRILRRFAKHTQEKPFLTLNRGDLENYLAYWVNEESTRVKGKSLDELGDGQKKKTSPAYMNFIRVVLKLFFKWLYQSETYPDCVKWIKTKKIQREISPETILTEKEVYRLIRAAGNSQDRAIIHMLYETGGRIGEIRSRKVGDLKFETVEDSLTVKLTIPQRDTKGKEKGKYLLLVDSAEAIQTWIGDHPNPLPDQPLWMSNRGALSYTSILRMLKRAAKKCGIKKPVNPHAFRHAQVTASAQYLADQELKKKFGWTPGSQMLQVYSHITDQTVETKELEMRGLKKINKQEKRIISHVKCERCGKVYSAGKTICECGRPLDPDLAKLWEDDKQEKEQQLTKLLDKLTNLPPEKLSVLEKLLE